MSNKISLYDLYEIKKKKDNKVNEAFNQIQDLIIRTL